MVDSQSPCLPRKSRLPLRERCQINGLTITPISYREWNKVYDCNSELVLVFEDEEEQKPYDPDHGASSSPTPSLIGDSHLVEVMGGLYIALVDDEADVAALRTFDDEPFTHIIQISYKTPRRRAPLSRANWRRKESPRNAPVQRLDLICPVISFCLRADQTAIGPAGLYAAREFLTLALPYGSTRWWPEELRHDVPGERRRRNADAENEQEGDDENIQVVYLAPDHGLDDLLNELGPGVEQDDRVNVLIVAPTRRAVDVLSVLLCYLAFLEGCTPDDLADTEYFDRVWNKVTLGRWSMLYVELITRCK